MSLLAKNSFGDKNLMHCEEWEHNSLGIHIHSFIQHTFFRRLLYARHYSRCQGDKLKQNSQCGAKMLDGD